MRQPDFKLAVGVWLSVTIVCGVGAQAQAVSLDGPAVLKINSQHDPGQPLDIDLSSTGDIYLAVGTDAMRFVNELEIIANQDIILLQPIESDNGNVILQTNNGKIDGGDGGIMIDTGSGDSANIIDTIVGLTLSNGGVIVPSNTIMNDTTITTGTSTITISPTSVSETGGTVIITSGILLGLGDSANTVTIDDLAPTLSSAPQAAASATTPIAWPHAATPVLEFTDENAIDVDGDVLLLINGPLGNATFDAGNSVFVASAASLGVSEPTTALLLVSLGGWAVMGMRRRSVIR